MAHDDAGTAILGEAPVAEPATREQRSSKSRALAVALIVSIATLVAALATLVVVLVEQRTDEQAAQDAVALAREYAVVMSTFDYQNLDANRERIAEMSTPAFAERYGSMVDALRELVTEGQGSAEAQALRAAAEHTDGDTATVLVFADQNATNVSTPDGGTSRFRMVFSLVRADDRWLVDNVETL
ncbi:mce associated protein mas1a [Rhodococcus sp. B50]|uniref:mce associated protein mas1a n=1 Tax=Rhodococcus sp. B50 TaxID=2682847 RepID=UPI001BD57234|nr:mce associated protein mas1a [Rhodococcus sp. B50]MBS9372179.1 hypothetical protein [Rhodococcus sp. B50]